MVPQKTIQRIGAGFLSLSLLFGGVSAAAETCANFGLDNPGVEESGNGMTVPFRSLLHIAFAQADILFLTEVNHLDLRAARFLAQQENYGVLAGNGVRHLFLEMPVALQPFVDALADGKTAKADFIREMQTKGGYFSFTSDKTVQMLTITADMIVHAAATGIKVRFADFGNGAELDSPLREAAYEALLLESGEAPEDVIHAARERLRGLQRDYDLARQDDRKLAALINGTVKSGEKGLLFYGAVHGSMKGDLEEHLAMPALKIDFYADGNVYYDRREMFSRNPVFRELGIGADKPELVYVLDAEILYTTCETPPRLTEKLRSPEPAM